IGTASPRFTTSPQASNGAGTPGGRRGYHAGRCRARIARRHRRASPPHPKPATAPALLAEGEATMPAAAAPESPAGIAALHHLTPSQQRRRHSWRKARLPCRPLPRPNRPPASPRFTTSPQASNGAGTPGGRGGYHAGRYRARIARRHRRASPPHPKPATVPALLAEGEATMPAVAAPESPGGIAALHHLAPSQQR